MHLVKRRDELIGNIQKAQRDIARLKQEIDKLTAGILRAEGALLLLDELEKDNGEGNQTEAEPAPELKNRPGMPVSGARGSDYGL